MHGSRQPLSDEERYKKCRQSGDLTTPLSELSQLNRAHRTSAVRSVDEQSVGQATIQVKWNMFSN